MNRQIQGIANVMLGGFVLLAGLLFYWQVVRAEALRGDMALNRTRLTLEGERTQRGKIVDRNGVVLAFSEKGENGWKRVYTREALAHVIGYHSLRFGNNAVEDGQDDYLSGRKGLGSLRQFGDRILHRPGVGNDVVLTIDDRLQAVADRALGTATGAVVALDPRSGEVLALASHPYFDPNTMEQQWDSILRNPGKPLLNRATQGLYPPGSTFKTLTLAAALEARVTRRDETFTYEMESNEQGQYYHDLFVQGFRIYDANHSPTAGRQAVLDLAHAYAESCNVTFADLGLRLGVRQLSEAAARFGFGSAIPIDIPSAVSRLGPNNVIAKGDPALASTAFGQGEIEVTPLQMALVAAAIAREGVIPKPYVVARVIGPEGEVTSTQPIEWRRALTPETARTVGAMMITSAEEGWAKTGKLPGITVAAKTGTAETGSGRQSHAWFVAYAPAENPTIAVAVVKEFAGGGATEAAPVAKAVMEAALLPGRN